MMALSALRPPFRVLAPINEVKEVLVHVKNVLSMANTCSADPDESLVWIYASHPLGNVKSV